MLKTKLVRPTPMMSNNEQNRFTEKIEFKE